MARPHSSQDKMSRKISSRSSLILVLAAVCLVVSLFVPIWQIDLDAPQYPEGLKLEIWADKIAGDVDIINGLNHYIGMKTLHSEDFIEFTVLPYLIGAFALLFLLVAILRSKKGLWVSLIAFALFGVIAMVDFWFWEYDYGHNLDPNAAIKVPGMSYQPPLIGFKQLLNFGAFSVPVIGGWLFIGAGVLVLLALLGETYFKGKDYRYRPRMAGMAVVSALLFSCGGTGPHPIKLNVDSCDFCRMTVSDGKFGAEIVTKKGRVIMFDDLSCMVSYIRENDAENIGRYYICDFPEENQLTDATTAWYVKHDKLRSPMGGNTAAFSSRSAADEFAAAHGAEVADWQSISSGAGHHHDDHDHTH